MAVNALNSWPAGPGELARRIREQDWAATPLGPSAHWPACLRALVDMLLPSSLPMGVLWGPDLIQLYNDGYRDLMGLKHPAGLGRPTRECWPEVWHLHAPIYERVLAGETLRFEDMPCSITRHGVPEDAWFTLSYSPLRDDAGSIAGVLVTGVETTERLRMQVALREREAGFRVLLEPYAQAVWEADAEGRVVTDSPSWRAYTGQTREDWLENAWALAVHPDDRESTLRRWREHVRAGTPLESELRLRGPDGGWRWSDMRATPLRDAAGRVCKWVVLNLDGTARRAARQEWERAEALAEVDRGRRVLVAELQHRSRNLLTLVRSLVSQSLRSSRSLDEAEARITDRLAALSRVHALLSRSEAPSVTVQELVEMEFGATASDTQARIVLQGPDVTLPGRAVRTFSLALHELATNAVKHGVLGAEGRGQVSVTWGLRDGTRLLLEWVETGRLAHRPCPGDSRGFGRELIEQALPYELDARTRLDIGEEGVRCTIEFPIEGGRP